MGRKKNKTSNKVSKRESSPKVKPKTSKPMWIVWLIGSLLVIWALSNFVGGNDYPRISTPKEDRGSADATVLIEEFSDLECPACRQAHPILKKVLEDYQGDVKWRFYHYPLSYHPSAKMAAVGAECANDQGLFWEYIDKVYENQQNMRKSDLINYGYEVGANESFKECFNSNTKDHLISADVLEANTREVRGTPTIYVNGRLVTSLSYDAISAMVESELR